MQKVPPIRISLTFNGGLIELGNVLVSIFSRIVPFRETVEGFLLLFSNSFFFSLPPVSTGCRGSDYFKVLIESSQAAVYTEKRKPSSAAKIYALGCLRRHVFGTSVVATPGALARVFVLRLVAGRSQQEEAGVGTSGVRPVLARRALFGSGAPG